MLLLILKRSRLKGFSQKVKSELQEYAASETLPKSDKHRTFDFFFTVLEIKGRGA
jgi:hypothetical protein